MAWFNAFFRIYYSCYYSGILFVSLYKAYESIVLDRHGKTGGSGRVGSIGFAGQLGRRSKRVNLVAGRVGSTRIFQINFFFFQLQKQVNDNMFGENE